MSQFPNFLKEITHFLDTLSEWSGRLVAWFILIMVLIIVYDVIMRKFFGIGSVALQELQWHLFSLVFLLGAAYTFKHDDHVRVDVIYQGRLMNDRRRAWINLIGGIFFLIPFCALIIWSSWGFIALSFVSLECSPDPGGLPYRFLLKAAIPTGFALLLLQGVADSLRSILFLLGYEQQLMAAQAESELHLLSHREEQL